MIKFNRQHRNGPAIGGSWRRRIRSGSLAAVLVPVMASGLVLAMQTPSGAGGTLTQVAPTSALVFDGDGYSGQLMVSGQTGTVSYTETASTYSTDVVVNSIGAISASASLAPGVYTVGGGDSDTASSPDTGTWGFTLTVGGTLSQSTASKTGQVVFGTAFAGALGFTASPGSVGLPLAVSATSGDTSDITVGPHGGLSSPPSLSPGTYTVSGTVTDTNDNQGTWAFTLTVGGILEQTSPTSDFMPFTSSGTVEGSYSGQLTVSGAGSNTVTFVTVSSSSPDLTVTGTGAISGTSSLAPDSHYTISGTDSDTASPADTGVWTFTLYVGGTLNQLDPLQVIVPDGQGYLGQLAVSSNVGNLGTVKYTVTSASPPFAVNSSGAIAVADTKQPGGPYVVSGTDLDSNGESGTWTFTVFVQLEQVAPMQASVAFGSGYTGQINVIGNVGTVKYTENSGPTHLMLWWIPAAPFLRQWDSLPGPTSWPARRRIRAATPGLGCSHWLSAPI